MQRQSHKDDETANGHNRSYDIEQFDRNYLAIQQFPILVPLPRHDMRRAGFEGRTHSGANVIDSLCQPSFRAVAGESALPMAQSQRGGCLDHGDQILG